MLDKISFHKHFEEKGKKSLCAKIFFRPVRPTRLWNSVTSLKQIPGVFGYFKLERQFPWIDYSIFPKDSFWLQIAIFLQSKWTNIQRLFLALFYSKGPLNVDDFIEIPVLVINIWIQNPGTYLIKGYSTLGVHYRDLQARVHEQETRNLTLHEAQPSAVLNFEFLVRERVLVNPIMHE